VNITDSHGRTVVIYGAHDLQRSEPHVFVKRLDVETEPDIVVKCVDLLVLDPADACQMAAALLNAVDELGANLHTPQPPA
jgi:hypothetical protein